MVVNIDECVKVIADKHFPYRKTCEIISKEEAQEYLVEATKTFLKFISQKFNGRDDKDLTCVKRSLARDTIIPVMFGLGKSHKGKLNMPPHRPVSTLVG